MASSQTIGFQNVPRKVFERAARYADNKDISRHVSIHYEGTNYYGNMALTSLSTNNIDEYYKLIKYVCDQMIKEHESEK